ncbi:hypothetical protein LTR33_012678, partial [Friedmanniomyces endolithicus]
DPSESAHHTIHRHFLPHHRASFHGRRRSGSTGRLCRHTEGSTSLLGWYDQDVPPLRRFLQGRDFVRLRENQRGQTGRRSAISRYSGLDWSASGQRHRRIPLDHRVCTSSSWRDCRWPGGVRRERRLRCQFSARL